MCTSSSNNALIDLGFTDEKFPKGTHICQIFSDDNEREEALLNFLSSGLASSERVACFTDKSSDESICKHLEGRGHDCVAAKSASQLTLAPTENVYFKDNRFDPDHMLATLTAFFQASENSGQTGARVIGEMHPRINDIDGGDRLLEYEAKVGLLQETYPVTAVCQYHVEAFDGATIMNILKVHPLMIVRGAVIRNPFFVPGRELLAQQGLN